MPPSPLERMRKVFSWLSARRWTLVIALAVVVAMAGHAIRIWHVNQVSRLAEGDAIAIDANSPTGYEAGARRIVIPKRSAESFQWIMQAQKMLADGSWRVERIDYDNAPEGRAVRSPSLYRWWLVTIASIDHALLGSPEGIAVERAALIADPVAQVVFIILTALFIARYFGGWSAALFSVGCVATFPLGGAFAPGQPDDSVFVIVFAVWSVLPLVAGLVQLSKGEGEEALRTCRRLFAIGGIAGGLGLWIGVATELPVLLGIAIAAAATRWIYDRRRHDDSTDVLAPLPWRAWALAGALVVLVAWLLERSPGLFEPASWRADFAHPLYALAWLGCGELLVFLDTRRSQTGKRRIVTLALAVAAIAGLGYTMVFRAGVSAWSEDAASIRLTRLAIGPDALGVLGWIREADGLGFIAIALVPCFLLIAALVALARVRGSAPSVLLLSIAIGPALVAFGFALLRLGWWNQLDSLLLVVAVAVLSLAPISRRLRGAVVGVVTLSSILGLFLVTPNLNPRTWSAVNRAELETLIERHLAQWLAARAAAPGAVTLAPPEVTIALAFYGGLRGLGTPYPENYDGVAAAVRLCAASTPDEARAMAEGREIEYVVHPSWDLFLEQYARLGSNQPENSFIANLNRWLPPRWLEPVAFQLPTVQGFEGEWVVVFRTVEMQDNASAIARLVEYFLDAGRSQQAAQAQSALASGFPDELATHIAGAQVAASRGERGAFGRELAAILAAIEAGSHEYLPWDLRVSMSLMLAGGKRFEEAKTQLEACIETITTERIKRLSPGSLNGLLLLSKAMNLEFPDGQQRALAVSLLPLESQKGL